MLHSPVLSVDQAPRRAHPESGAVIPGGAGRSASGARPTGWWRGALVVVVALFAVLGAAAPASAATSPEYLGLNQQPLVKDVTIPEARWGEFLAPQRAAGMTIGRYDVNWALVEPRAPVNGVRTYDWNQGGALSRRSIDRGILELARYGIRASPVFTAPPSWVPQGGNRLPAERYGDFAAFIQAFAARYGPGGAFWAEHPDVAPLPTYDYEIWNEVNAAHAWDNERPDAGQYAALLAQVHPAVHAVQPDARVLASIGWPILEDYMNTFFAAGGGPFIDGVGFHPYSPNVVGISDLVKRMRAILVAHGRGGLPIQATESGIVAATGGPGAISAGDGPPSDAARAATQAFVAEALAHSDCNVGQFLVYGVTNIATGADGNMGVFNAGDASPTLTATALSRASLRWNTSIARAGSGLGRLAICSQGRTADAALLPLELSTSRNSSTCVAGQVGYDGNPLESARLVLTTGDGRRQSTEVNAYGRALVCLPAGAPISSFNVYAEVPNQARSAVRECEVPVQSCATVVRPAPAGDLSAEAPRPGQDPVVDQAKPQGSGSQGGPTASSQAFGCWTVTMRPRQPKRDKRGSRSKATVLLGATCKTQPKRAKLKFTMSFAKKGKKTVKKVRTVTLTNAKPRVVTVHTVMRKGDRIVLHRAADRKTGLPAIRLEGALKSPKR